MTLKPLVQLVALGLLAYHLELSPALQRYLLGLLEAFGRPGQGRDLRPVVFDTWPPKA